MLSESETWPHVLVDLLTYGLNGLNAKGDNLPLAILKPVSESETWLHLRCVHVLDGVLLNDMYPFCFFELVSVLIRLSLAVLKEGFIASCDFLVFRLVLESVTLLDLVNGERSLVFSFKLDLESMTRPSGLFLLIDADRVILLKVEMRSDSVTLVGLLLPGLRGLDAINDWFALFTFKRPDKECGNDFVTRNFDVPVSTNLIFN